MDKEMQFVEGAGSARRRLLKGSFAVPAVLTIASGSALARTSSGCIVGEAAAGETSDFDTTNETWQRVLAYTFLKNPGSDRSYWIRYEEIHGLAILAGVAIQNDWITAGQALCVQSGTAATGSSQHVSGTIYSSSTTPILPTLTSSDSISGSVRYYAVIVDSSGNIIGISLKFTASGQTGGAVHQSCWNSFKPV